jgi:tetratricopeptide (TPR) repeat protein
MRSKPTGRKAEGRKQKTEDGAAVRAPWWAKLAAVLLSPLVFLILAELILSVAGYGIPKSFFIPCKSQGKTVYVSNRHYCEHFVPKELSRTPEPVTLEPKGANTVRIFVLGGSAAYGDPDPAYGFCRQLEVLLNEQADGVSFEVVNAAVTSMNSHVAKRIAQDAARRRPDAFIVYMGNNEVVGPYGPSSLPAALYSSEAFIDLAIAVKKQTRLGQLLKNVAQVVRTRGKPQKQWQGMEAFLSNRIRADDPRMESCYRHFSTNIRDIVKTADAAGAKTILCTVPTNIESCRPFGSDHNPTLTSEQLSQWKQHFEKGEELAKAGDFEPALAQYRQAHAIDAGSADLAFRTGQTLLALGRIEEAKKAFSEACDLDTLRFRADSRINAAIREAGSALADSGVTLLDLQAKLEACCENQLLGDELLVDHVHLNPRGNFLAAYTAMQAIGKAVPRAKLKPVGRSEEQLFDLCEQRLLYDTTEQYRLTMAMYRRKTLPPFAGQMDHDAESEHLRQEIVALRQATKGQNVHEASFVDALRQMPLDPYLTIRYGEWLLANRRAGDAVALYRKQLDAKPFDMRVRVAMAQALARSGARDQAIQVITSNALPDRFSPTEALLTLGVCYAGIGAVTDAASIYSELTQIEPDNVDAWVNLAAAASTMNDLAKMKESLEKALKMDPASVQALINMGNYYAKENQPAEAQRWFEKAIQVDPYDYLARIGLGVQSVRAGQRAKGLEEVTAAVTLKPDFVEGYQILAALHAQDGKNEEAKRYAALAALFQP